MRITVDLQAAQTEGSFQRGIGRYSESFARSLLDGSTAATEIHLCFNGAYDVSRQTVSRNLQLSASRTYDQSTYRYPPLHRGAGHNASARVAVAEELIRSHWLATKPDVLHLSHLGEGFGGRSVVPRSLPSIPGGVRSATLYDLIPLRFPAAYLGDASFRRLYLGHLDVIRQCDLLLAISESSRRDAIELLGLHPDSVRTIWGGVDPHFTPGDVRPERADDLRARLGLGRRFVLYTGGDDYRKNLGGAVEAFAALPTAVRRGVRLVIVCSIQPNSRAAYLRTAKGLGLDPDDVVFTGFVSEADLVDLYRLCEVFIFPSLYEGFGLPVVEAIACGAPTIGGDHSSIREIIGRDDALFDSARTASIATTLARVLSDAAFARDLAAHARQRAKVFTWAETGRLAIAAFEEAVSRKRPANGIVLSGWMPKRRLAFFSPLPPCKSGIADHSALLLRHLGHHFDIELFIDDDYDVGDEVLDATFAIHPHHRFGAMHARFDAVMYELGNSSFHAYMLPYLEKYPGIVTLHDAYLSGLFGFLEFGNGEAGRNLDEMLRAHGPLARRFFAPRVAGADAVTRAAIALPCTKRVLDQAIGIIAHSPFNVATSRSFYPRGWRAPFRVVRQLVGTPPLPVESERIAIRQRLGFGRDDVIVATFGHVAWTKCGDVLLDAFRRSRAGTDRRARLVFVGAMTQDDFGDRLALMMEAGPPHEQVSVTGFLDDAAFADYLAITDIAFQLRKNSRGGTPKGVLDCMAVGVPVVVNAEASYLDYPDDVMVRLPPDFDAQLVAGTIDAWIDDAAGRERLGAAGRAYVLDRHHPVKLAADYAMAINEFIDRQKAIDWSSRLKRLGELRSDQFDAEDVAVVAGELAVQNALATIHPRRLLIDVSHLDASDHGTGIPRVVRSIVTALYLTERPDFEPVAVLLDKVGHIEVATRLLESFGVSGPAFHDRGSIELRDGDTLLMLDSSWARWSEFSEVHRRIRETGGTIITAIYDLLPIRLPYMSVEGGPSWFAAWLHEALAASDAVVCISRAVADDLGDYIESLGADRFRELKIGYWHLGADFGGQVLAPPRAEVKRAFERQSFLMVGTIEPRKRHGVALEACERLWKAGRQVHLVIIGRKGWMVDALIARLQNHPELGRRLHLFLDATDADLQYAYTHAAALLFPSAGEGFGLPLVEAAHQGLPVIANDLAVLREIGGDHVTYVSSDDAAVFSAGIERWMAIDAEGGTPNPRGMPYLDWAESAAQLVDVVVDNHWYRTI